MRILSIMNGWVEAPHCWRHHLFSPIQVDNTPGWCSIQILGFVFFVETRKHRENANEIMRQNAVDKLTGKRNI